MIPDTLKIVLFVGSISLVIYGGLWALATYPPEPSSVTRALPDEFLKQK